MSWTTQVTTRIFTSAGGAFTATLNLPARLHAKIGVTIIAAGYEHAINAVKLHLLDEQEEVQLNVVHHANPNLGAEHVDRLSREGWTIERH